MKLRVSKSFLAEQKTVGGTRRFVRTRDHLIAIKATQWVWAMAEAAHSLHLDQVDCSSVHLAGGLSCPRVSLYTRRWKDKGRDLQEMFESIHEGTVIEVEIFIPTTLECSTKTPGEMRPPTEQEFRDIMNFVGKYIGLSPWGSKFGYGRFRIESLRVR